MYKVAKILKIVLWRLALLFQVLEEKRNIWVLFFPKPFRKWFRILDRIRRRSRDEDPMGAIIIRAKVAVERYKIRSICLSVLNTTETNLDTSLFGVIYLTSPPTHNPSRFPSSGPPAVRGIVPGPFSLLARPAADKAPAFSARRRHFETHASSIKQRLHSSPIVSLFLKRLHDAKITNATLTQGVSFSRRYRKPTRVSVVPMYDSKYQ